jgi:hypothetical protein
MRVSAEQLRYLRRIRELKDRPPTVAGYFRSAWKIYLFLVLVGGVGIGFFVWAGWPGASGLFAGLVSATILRDFRWYRHIVQSWHLTIEITDWKRVDELLDSARAPAT